MALALPPSVQEIADVIGARRALWLVGQLPKCGKRARRRVLYVPTARRLCRDHQLVRILGWDEARMMVDEFGGCKLELATCSDLVRAWHDRVIEKRWRRGDTPEDAWAELTADGLHAWIALSSLRKKFQELARIERAKKTRQRECEYRRGKVPETTRGRYEKSRI